MKKKTIIILLVLMTSVVGINSGFMCEPETVPPGTDMRCITKIVNFYVKADGTTKTPEITYGTVKANANGQCPDPIIEWKNQ